MNIFRAHISVLFLLVAVLSGMHAQVSPGLTDEQLEEVKHNFFQAVKANDTETVGEILALGRVDVNCKYEWGSQTALYIAVAYGNLEMIEKIVYNGASINYGTSHGESPLHYAAESGQSSMVELLVRCGADPNVKDRSGNTPFHYAAASGQLSMIEVLVRCGADPNVKNKLGNTALHSAIHHSNSRLDKVKVLVKNGARLDIKDDEGYTPFTLAKDRNDKYTAIVKFFESLKS